MPVPAPRRAFGLAALRAVPYPWWVVVLTTVAMVGDGLVVQGIPVLYPFIRRELGLTLAQVGLVTSAIVATSMVTVLLGGWVSDRWGAKRILVVVLAYTAVPVFLLVFVDSLWGVVLVGMLIGIGVGPVYPVTSKAIMDWLPVRIRGFGMSLKQTGPTMAGALAALTLPALSVAFGWRASAIVLAAVCLAVALVFLLFYRDRPSGEVSGRKLSPLDFLEIAKDRDLVLLTMWGFFFVAAQFIVLSYLILFLVEAAGLSGVGAGGILSMALIGSTVARILWGAASDFLLKSQRRLTLALMGGMAALAFAAISFTGEGTSPVLLAVIALGLGATALSWPGVFTAYVAEVAGAGRSGTAIGTTNAVMRLGVVAGPPLFGLLVDVTGSYSLGWGLTGIAAFVPTAVLFLWGREPAREQAG